MTLKNNNNKNILIDATRKALSFNSNNKFYESFMQNLKD